MLKEVIISNASAHDCLPLSENTSEGENDAVSDDVSVASREGDLSWDFAAVTTARHNSVLNIQYQKISQKVTSGVEI